MGRLFGLGGENTMRFTSDELMFITSMTKGPIPFGIFFEKRRGTKAKEAAIEARQALIEKGILTEDGITKKGFAVIKLWEDYRNTLSSPAWVTATIPSAECGPSLRNRNSHQKKTTVHLVKSDNYTVLPFV